MEKIIYCADVIALRGEHVVAVKRLKDGGGLALPGGKQEQSGEYVEPLSKTALRELFEETGLTGTIKMVFVTTADDGRDPRGRFVSTFFVVEAEGELAGEPGKTEPIELTKDKARALLPEFMFDHGEVLGLYLAQQH